VVSKYVYLKLKVCIYFKTSKKAIILNGILGANPEKLRVYSIGSVEVAFVHQQRLLGVHISSDLHCNVDTHIVHSKALNFKLSTFWRPEKVEKGLHVAIYHYPGGSKKIAKYIRQREKRNDKPGLNFRTRLNLVHR